MVKFPDVTVKLAGTDGNAYTLLGRVAQALRRAGHGDSVAEFQKEATSGDYDHLLQTCMAYVKIE